MNTASNELTLSQLRMPVANVIDKYFGGDSVFFETFQAACASQLTLDLQRGQAASSELDTDALMRTAHNLKSVLLMLGFASISQEATICEQYSLGGQVQLAQASWNRLALFLKFILASGALQPQGFNEKGL